MAKIKENTEYEFNNKCTIYFEEIALSMINFIDITESDTFIHSEKL